MRAAPYKAGAASATTAPTTTRVARRSGPLVSTCRHACGGARRAQVERPPSRPPGRSGAVLGAVRFLLARDRRAALVRPQRRLALLLSGPCAHGAVRPRRLLAAVESVHLQRRTVSRRDPDGGALPAEPAVLRALTAVGD